jgi:hypothetical protein
MNRHRIDFTEKKPVPINIIEYWGLEKGRSVDG